MSEISPADDSTAPWFVPLPATKPAPAQAFVFPHVGAGCATFARCASLLSGKAQLRAVNLPGRQARFGEPSRTEIGPLVHELADAVPEHLDGRPFSVIGYCGGALLGYLLTAELAKRGGRAPSRLVIVSFSAPHRIWIDPELFSLPGNEFWERITALGGVHPILATDPDARELFEEPLRADYALLAGYKHEDGPPLDVPVTIISGRDDTFFGDGELARWSELCSTEPGIRLVPGGHWLLEDDPAALAAALAEEVGAS